MQLKWSNLSQMVVEQTGVCKSLWTFLSFIERVNLSKGMLFSYDAASEYLDVNPFLHLVEAKALLIVLKPAPLTHSCTCWGPWRHARLQVSTAYASLHGYQITPRIIAVPIELMRKHTWRYWRTFPAFYSLEIQVGQSLALHYLLSLLSNNPHK